MANTPKPWIAINLLTGEQIGRYEKDTDAVKDCFTRGIDSYDLSYRPRAKRTKRTFP